jgi:hypothetical protein
MTPAPGDPRVEPPVETPVGAPAVIPVTPVTSVTSVTALAARPPSRGSAGGALRVPALFCSAAQRLAALALPLGLLWAAVAWALGGAA